MRKTIIYLSLLALLAICIWFISRRQSDGMYEADEAGFTITDTAKIGKIYLSANDGYEVLLERKPEGWTVNGAHQVLPAPLALLMKTLATQVAVVPVPESRHNMVVTQLSGSGIKVELYDVKGKKMRVFYVGYEAPGQGTYMLVEGASRPYIVNIPLFEGVLMPRYSNNVKDWRDRRVFHIAAEDIEQVSVQYIDEPLNSFIMRREADNSISVKLDSAMVVGEPLNMDRVQAYLGFFTNANCEGYTNGLPFMDSMLRALPRRCIVDVIGKNGYTQHMTVYWRYLYERSKNLNTPVPGHRNEYDSDRFYAVFNDNKDTAVIQTFVFEKILRNGYEFYQQSVPQQPADTTVLHHHQH